MRSTATVNQPRLRARTTVEVESWDWGRVLLTGTAAGTKRWLWRGIYLFRVYFDFCPPAAVLKCIPSFFSSFSSILREVKYRPWRWYLPIIPTPTLTHITYFFFASFLAPPLLSSILDVFLSFGRSCRSAFLPLFATRDSCGTLFFEFFAHAYFPLKTIHNNLILLAAKSDGSKSLRGLNFSI